MLVAVEARMRHQSFSWLHSPICLASWHMMELLTEGTIVGLQCQCPPLRSMLD